MKYENQTKEHLVELINKRGESGKGALGYILYKAESKRLEQLYTKSQIEQGIMHLEFEDALGNFYLYMWNGAYFEKLKDPKALGSWIGKIFYRFLLRVWQTIKKLERAMKISQEEKIHYSLSEQMEISLQKTALSLALIYQTQVPERRYAFLHKLLKKYLRQDGKKMPPYELTSTDVAYVMGIKDDRYRQWAKRVSDEVKRMSKTTKVDQLVCMLNAESITLAERICNGGIVSITDWIKDLLEQTEEQLSCCNELCRFRDDLRAGRRNHIVPERIRPVGTPSASMIPIDSFAIMREFDEPMERPSVKDSYSIEYPSPTVKHHLKIEPVQPKPEKKVYLSILEKMLGI